MQVRNSTSESNHDIRSEKLLSPDEVPRDWYNIQADLPEPIPPPLDPKTKQPADPGSLERIFAKELIRQEVSSERFVRIPEEVREAYVRIGRPTPLVRAVRLERFLGTPAKIYYKCEYPSPTGSHSPTLLWLRHITTRRKEPEG